jgi:hypothetical protein
VATIDALGDRAVDSCASPDSRYVNELLPGRRTLVTLAFPRVPGTGMALRAIAAATRNRS